MSLGHLIRLRVSHLSEAGKVTQQSQSLSRKLLQLGSSIYFT